MTYDLRTIPDLLSTLAAEEGSHAGVLFVDEATLRPNDYGGLIRALLAHWQRYHHLDWTDRVAFLTPG